MKIRTINISFVYFALCLGGTIRYAISDFKYQDGSGFGQMPNEIPFTIEDGVDQLKRPAHL